MQDVPGSKRHNGIGSSSTDTYTAESANDTHFGDTIVHRCIDASSIIACKLAAAACSSARAARARSLARARSFFFRSSKVPAPDR